MINLTTVEKYCEIFCICIGSLALLFMNPWLFVFNSLNHSQLITKEKSPKVTLDKLIKLIKRGTFELRNTICH